MAKSIMIQGTMSNAGKSFLAAGLCRIFRQDGYRVAPFKSQNMALNSFITEDGLEMGRAQVVQAEAAGIRPEACMNPVLLKPTSQMGSQVIVNGRVLGTYSAADYYRMKKGLIPKVMEAYHSLEERFDVIVIEGAGSPAEINLREHDFVNMGLAELTDSPVLLAGDIDRGGVFAQLYGTAALLEEQERKRIRAFLINKFRGDPEILTPGLSMLYKRIPIPVAGVIPYLDVDLEDEDSLSERLSGSRRETGLDVYGKRAFGRVAVIRLPRISNFTDFHALERLPGIVLFYASRTGRSGKCGFYCDSRNEKHHGRSEMDAGERDGGRRSPKSGKRSHHGNLRRISDIGRGAFGSLWSRGRRQHAGHGPSSGKNLFFKRKNHQSGNGADGFFTDCNGAGSEHVQSGRVWFRGLRLRGVRL